MKIKYFLCALPLLFAAASSFAAIEYEFRQMVRSDVQSVGSGDVYGKGVIDGDRSRIEFRSQDQKTTRYTISDGIRQVMLVVDPASKTYMEAPLEEVFKSLGGNRIEITNFKKEVTKLDDHPTIAGYPTDHYRLVTSYDATLTVGDLKLRQLVQTTIDKWVTSAFGDIGEMFLASSSMQTGNPAVDQLIEAETANVKGFALRQLMTVVTTSKDLPHDSRSVVKIKPTRRQSTEFLVSAVRLVTVDPAVFTVPADFKRVTPGELAAGSVGILNMQ